MIHNTNQSYRPEEAAAPATEETAAEVGAGNAYAVPDDDADAARGVAQDAELPKEDLLRCESAVQGLRKAYLRRE